jgi:hypothetical protein
LNVIPKQTKKNRRLNVFIPAKIGDSLRLLKKCREINSFLGKPHICNDYASRVAIHAIDDDLFPVR